MLEGRIEPCQWHRSDAGEAHCNSVLAVSQKQAVLPIPASCEGRPRTVLR
jgi:hypothetical protein